jgi:seryl-tRNA synthetase
LIESIATIQPKVRERRGIHIIFGDIIQADTEQINNALKTINTNENRIISKINEQVEINKNMINRFREIENHINGEVQALTDNINQAKQHLDDIEMTLITDQNLHSIEYVLRSLQQHVDEILNSVQ